MDYKANDIDRIIPLERNRLVVIFKDGTEVETDQVYFHEDGELEFGYIYS